MEKRPLQWHPGFQAALQIELEEDRDCLQFHREYNLAEKPLQIDTLIVKADPGRTIRKNIGRIFRQDNIVEYKSPGDYISINDFFKVMAYTCLFQSHTRKEQEIPPEELTITLAGSHFPIKLAGFLRKHCGAVFEKTFPGIYYAKGLLFPLQILIIDELSRQDNMWLSRLRQDLNRDDDIQILAQACDNRPRDPLYSAVIDLIIRANWKEYKEGIDMCDALNELIAEIVEERSMAIVQAATREAAEAAAKAAAKEAAQTANLNAKRESIITLLDDLGPVPEDLRARVMAQEDTDELTRMLKLAAKSNTLVDFSARLGTVCCSTVE